jgi:hypothetical protein
MTSASRRLIVSIPMSVPIHKATRAFYTFMGSLLGIFVLIFVVLNIMLNSIIVKPLARMAQYLGPVATILGRREASKAKNVQDLYHSLAAHIAIDQERKRFLQGLAAD